MNNLAQAQRATVKRASPCFVVQDVTRTAAYYRDVLGFCSGNLCGDPPTFAILSRDGGDVMFQQATVDAVESLTTNDNLVRGTCDIFIGVGDIQTLAEELHVSRAEVVVPLVHRPIYDGYEMIVRDCDGRLICFNQSTED